MMYSFTTSALVAASLLASFASAAPVQPEERADITCFIPANQNANFDGLGGLPGTNLNQIPSPYKALKYRGFTYANTVLAGLTPGVRPQSGRSYAVTNILTQNLPPSGTPSDLNDLPVISVDASDITFFDLQSLYYGCAVIATPTSLGLPVSCDITVTGYLGTPENPGTQVCQRKLEYRPAAGPTANMAASGVLNAGVGNGVGGCVGLQFASVSVEVVGPLSPAARGVSVLLDEVKYGTRDCTV